MDGQTLKQQAIEENNSRYFEECKLQIVAALNHIKIVTENAEKAISEAKARLDDVEESIHNREDQSDYNVQTNMGRTYSYINNKEAK